MYNQITSSVCDFSCYPSCALFLPLCNGVDKKVHIFEEPEADTGAAPAALIVHDSDSDNFR